MGELKKDSKRPPEKPPCREESYALAEPLVMPATLESVSAITDWVLKLAKPFFSELTLQKLGVAADDMVANVSLYSYPEEAELIEVSCGLEGEFFFIRICDRGQAFNPLEFKDPDVTLPPAERPIGGLGIFLARRYSNDMRYERREGMNILTILLKIKKHN